MLAQTERNTLLSAVQRSQGPLSDKSLGHIAIKASSNHQLVIHSSDRLISIFCNIAADVKTQGVAVVQGRIFADLVRELPDGPVTLSSSGSILQVSAGHRSEFAMRIPLVEDIKWEEPPVLISQNKATVPAKGLSYMIDQVQSCIQTDSPRNYGSVGYMHKLSEGTIRLVGSDGYRLSYCDLDVTTEESFLKSGVCISKRCLAEILRMCAEGFENVDIQFADDGSSFVAQVPDYLLFGRLSSVRYPKYQGVLPKALSNSISIQKQTIQGMTRRVMLAADKSHAVQLKFAPSKLTMSSRTLGSSDSVESADLADFDNKVETLLSVNGRYLSDVFTSTDSEQVNLKFQGKEDPFLLFPEKEPIGCKSVHVLVPIRENI